MQNTMRRRKQHQKIVLNSHDENAKEESTERTQNLNLTKIKINRVKIKVTRELLKEEKIKEMTKCK